MTNKWRKTKMAYEEIKGNELMKLSEKGDVIEGLFVGFREEPSTVYPGKNSILIDLDIDGETKSAFVTDIVRTKMREIEKGEKVRITHLGKLKSTKNKGQSYNNFKVEVDRQ